MTRAHFVKKARKNYPAQGIKKGESYWWWKFMVGGRGGPKRFSKARPRPSQLTQSSFLSSWYSIEEMLEDFKGTSLAELECLRDDMVSSLQDLSEETQSSYDNLPQGFQDGSQGEMLQARVDACDEWVSSLESIDFDSEEQQEEEDVSGKRDEMESSNPGAPE